MSLPPTIPTSFVPHPASSSSQRFRLDFMGAFGFIAYLILFGVVVLAIGVFIYGNILNATQLNKDADLAKAKAGIDAATAQSFVRLNDRLSSGMTLLNGHVELSSFFAAVEALLPATVRFSSLHVTFNDAGAVTLDGSGTAKSFNALAAASASFAADGRIKDAIFSHIAVNKDNSVSFSLTAALDQKLVAFTPTVPVATSTVRTTGSPQATSTTPSL